MGESIATLAIGRSIGAAADRFAGMGAEIIAALTPARSAVLESVPAATVQISDLEDLERSAAANGAQLLVGTSHGVEVTNRLGIALLRGGHQERGRRAGTENSASIVALGAACEQALANMAFENTEVKALRDRLEKGILAQVPNAFVTGDPDNRLPNTCNIAFEYIEGEGILLLLNKQGIAASSGSACTSGSLEPSHVLRAMGIPYTAAHGTIRFSLSRYSTEAEIDRVIEAVPPIIAQLRKLSPYWDENGPVESSGHGFAPAYA